MPSPAEGNAPDMTTAVAAPGPQAGAGLSVPARTAMFVAFLLSGGCGLAYEVVWTRLIAREVGHTSFALATVLAAFMGGLALGSWIATRAVGRVRNPVAWYGVLEIAIGVSALAVPLLLRLFHPAIGWLYRAEGLGAAYHAARFGICALVLLVPTTCMGATLAFLAEPLVRRREELGRTIGWLYATNTLGAVLGAVAAGFLLVPSLGLAATIQTAAATNVAVGVVALLVARGGPLHAAAIVAPAPTGGRPIFLWGMLLSGALAMANQVVWTRYLSLQIGTSVYAFAIIVAAFILGMAVGSVVFGRLADRSRDAVAVFGAIQVSVGLSCLLLYLLFHLLAVGVWDLVESAYGSFGRLQFKFFLAVFATVFLPTFFLGGTFPTAVRGYVPEGTRTGPAVGRVYAWNTVGAILGSFAGGFLVVPNLGVWRSILGLGAANVALGSCILIRSAARTRWLSSVACLGLAAGGIAVLPSWSDEYLMQGAYVYAAYSAYDAREGGKDEWTSPLITAYSMADRICYYKDGASASVSVVATTSDVRSLRIDGRVQASNTGDMPTQVLIAQLPILLHPGPVRHVLTVGLGSGVTAGSATVHPGVHVDCVEISPEVVECAKRFYGDVNLGVCERPDVARVIVEDARSHIAFTERRYDVICAEPSHVFISGMGDLFTREYYELCRARLAPGGTMCQWVQAYWHTADDVRTIVATFTSVFPRTWMWEVAPGQDYLLIGAIDGIDPGAVERRWTGAVAEEMARIRYRRPAHLFAGYVAGPEEIARWVAGARLQEDDTVHLEFSAPRGLYEGAADCTADINAMRTSTRPPADWPAGALECWRARGKNMAIRASRGRTLHELLEEALALVPDDPNAQGLVRSIVFDISKSEDGVIDEMARRFPDSLDLLMRAGQVAYRANRIADAERWLREAAERFPRAAEPLFQLAELLQRTGRKGDAALTEAEAWERWRAIRKGAPWPGKDSRK